MNNKFNIFLLMTVNDRIIDICKGKKIKQLDLAKMGCGSKQSINAIFKNKNKPGIQFIEAFLRGIPDIDARWLITGEYNLIVMEDGVKYGFCKECLKKEAVIDYQKKELDKKDKRIEELIVEVNRCQGESENLGKKAQ